MMDSLLQYPSKDPMIPYTQKSHDKTMGKGGVAVKGDVEDTKVQCTECGKLCLNERGLSIHKGKAHNTESKTPSKRKRIELDECEANANVCPSCSYKSNNIDELRWHEVKCHRRPKILPLKKLITQRLSRIQRCLSHW